METGEHTPTTDELLQQILAQQSEHRAEVAQLRKELADQKAQRAVPAPSSTRASAEELAQQRAEEIDRHDFYCPGCGKLVDYPQRCEGRAEAPHPPIEVVSTDELKNAPDQSDQDAYREWQSKHSAAPSTDTLRGGTANL